jgi:hypothetical protein
MRLATIERRLERWLRIALIASLFYLSARVGFHWDGWLHAGDHLQADAQVTSTNTKHISTVAANAAQPVADNVIQMAVKGQMAMDSVQGAADKANDVLDNVRDTTAEMIDVAGTANLLLTHAATKLDQVHAEKIDQAIDAVRELGVEGKGTATAATGFLDAGAGTLKSAKKLLDDSDPLMVNAGKISGDGYVYLHKVLNPDKHGHYTKMDYLKAAAYTGLRTAPGTAEFLYYFSNIKK